MQNRKFAVKCGIRAALAAACLWLCPAPGAVPESPGGVAPAPIEHVILVSVDGLMPESYTQADRLGLKVPTLREMMRAGTWSEGAQSVFPTITYPGHTSIATGTNPGVHGIVTNEAWDPLEENENGWRWYAEDIRVPALWDAAREGGLKTALVWWPVTVGARATALVPEIWRASTPEDVKLARALSTPGLLEAVENRFPQFRAGFTPVQVKDQALTDIAVHLLETLKPHLLMLHIFEVDHWQHHRGVWSRETMQAIENADAQLARLIEAARRAGTWERTALVVVSEHGFAQVTRRVRPGVLLRNKGLVEVDRGGQVTRWDAVVTTHGGSAYVYVNNKDDEATRKALVELFQREMRRKSGGIASVLTQQEIRARGGDPAAFLALVAHSGFEFGGGYAGKPLVESPRKAAHGYLPEWEEMRAALLVCGPGIAPGKLENARLIDLAPTVARWLGFRMEKAEGSELGISRK